VVQSFSKRRKDIGRMFREDFREFFDGIKQSVRFFQDLSSGTGNFIGCPM